MVGKTNGGVESGSSGDNEIVYRSDDEPSGTQGENGIPVVEPETIRFEPDASEQPRRGRGRPRGSSGASTKSSRADQKQATTDLTGILLSIHLMAASIVQVKELELDEKEAQRLSAAINRVNVLYGGFILPEKQLAWINLAVTMGHVYGPRAMAYKLRMKTEAEEKKAKSGPGVITMQPSAVR